ncbi:hypothetical protein BKA62DRAFT_353469 [Auriculariales sp. MPI-PUGE-AT-0066]|nr:hypothetical protein BKA62DRAFT_353469 [Auriculariales sp. MPI-PUGE-AT-0066]
MEDPRLPQRHAPARIADLVHRMHRWRLRDVTLAHVLDGQTCSPIGLDDFEAYMTFLANSLQDLQFIVWFHDYAGRFFALPQELQKRCPGPSSDNFPEKRYKFYHRTKLSVTTWASGESGVELEALKKDVSTAMSDSHDHGEDARPANRQPCPFRGRLRALSSAVRSMSSQSRSESLGGKDSTVPGVSSCEPGCICAQPLREECLNIAHTFLRPTSNKFLDTDKELMYQTIQRLTETTHPVAFIQLYERVYDNLERVHLRQFFVMATMNLNSRQQWTWYWISISNLLASLAIALSTILLIPRGNPNTRAWRSFSVPFSGICDIIVLRVVGSVPDLLVQSSHCIASLGVGGGRRGDSLAVGWNSKTRTSSSISGHQFDDTDYSTYATPTASLARSWVNCVDCLLGLRRECPRYTYSGSPNPSHHSARFSGQHAI